MKKENYLEEGLWEDGVAKEAEKIKSYNGINDFRAQPINLQIPHTRLYNTSHYSIDRNLALSGTNGINLSNLNYLLNLELFLSIFAMYE